MAYHVNPDTGVPSLCNAVKGKCPFGGAEDHAENALDAVKKMERRLKDEAKGVLRSGGHKLLPTFARYQNGGGLFIGYVSAKEGPYADLTVNIPGVPLAEDEIIVNGNLYDKAMLRAAEKAGLFTYTGQKVPSGYVTYPIAKLSPTFHHLALSELPPDEEEEPQVPCDDRHGERVQARGYCAKCGGA